MIRSRVWEKEIPLFGFQEIFEMNDLVLSFRGIPGDLDFCLAEIIDHRLKFRVLFNDPLNLLAQIFPRSVKLLGFQPETGPGREQGT